MAKNEFVNKRQLRTQLRTKLAALTQAQRQKAADAAGHRVVEFMEHRQIRSLLCCLSFGDEIDTWGLVQRLIESGRRIYVPRTNDDGLSVHSYPCDLETLHFGLRQPTQQSVRMPESEVMDNIDACLLLGLGFDARGYRLGYGRGYFDRFLMRHRLVAIGLAFECQLVPAVPVEPHDIPMTAIITEGELRVMKESLR